MTSESWYLILGSIIGVILGSIIGAAASIVGVLITSGLQFWRDSRAREWELADRQRERHERFRAERLLTPIISHVDDTLEALAIYHWHMLDTIGDPESEMAERESKRIDASLDRIRIKWGPVHARIQLLKDETLLTRWGPFADAGIAWAECYEQRNVSGMGEALHEMQIAAAKIIQRLGDLEVRIPAQSKQTVIDQD